MDAKPDPLYRKSIEVPKRLNLKNDPRPFYAFVSEKAVNMINSYPFSAVEFCPGANFHPMNFLADAAGNNLSSYTVVELVPETCRFLEDNKASKKIQILKKDMADEMREISAGRKKYSLLVLSCLQNENFERIIQRLRNKVRYVLLYAQSAERFSSLLPNHAITAFSFHERAPSALFASLK